ncbi:MAG: DUF6869 domain-containing protein [Novosphingobium sp.]
MPKIWQRTPMSPDTEQVAADFIAYALFDPDDAPDEVFARGWVIYDLVEDDPTLAWDVIKKVVRGYAEDDLILGKNPDAQRVVGRLAAGPLEDLLGVQGPQFIDIVEAEARLDRRMAWTLGGVWQNSMPDDIWLRVQRAAADMLHHWNGG